MRDAESYEETKTSKINNNTRYGQMCNNYSLVDLSLSDSSDQESDGNKKTKNPKQLNNININSKYSPNIYCSKISFLSK